MEGQEGVKRQLACKTGYFLAYFRRTDAKARRTRDKSSAQGEEWEKNNACTHTIVKPVSAFKYERGYPIGYFTSRDPQMFV